MDNILLQQKYFDKIYFYLRGNNDNITISISTINEYDSTICEQIEIISKKFHILYYNHEFYDISCTNDEQFIIYQKKIKIKKEKKLKNYDEDKPMIISDNQTEYYFPSFKGKKAIVNLKKDRNDLYEICIDTEQIDFIINYKKSEIKFINYIF